MKLSDQLRAAVDASGMSRYRICKTLDISQASMSRFMSGKSGLSLEAIDALAELLEITIKTPKRKRTHKKES
jgi:transcriptional regulator with XRE-family HTH domain